MSYLIITIYTTTSITICVLGQWVCVVEVFATSKTISAIINFIPGMMVITAKPTTHVKISTRLFRSAIVSKGTNFLHLHFVQFFGPVHPIQSSQTLLMVAVRDVRPLLKCSSLRTIPVLLQCLHMTNSFLHLPKRLL